MAKSLKAFDEKKAELEHAVEVAISQRESASKRQREDVKDYKNAEAAGDKARECREVVVNEWKDSDEGRTFLEDASLQDFEIGQSEACWFLRGSLPTCLGLLLRKFLRPFLKMKELLRLLPSRVRFLPLLNSRDESRLFLHFILPLLFSLPSLFLGFSFFSCVSY